MRELIWTIVVAVVVFVTVSVAGWFCFVCGKSAGEDNIRQQAIEAGAADIIRNADGTCHFEFRKARILIDIRH